MRQILNFQLDSYLDITITRFKNWFRVGLYIIEIERELPTSSNMWGLIRAGNDKK